MFHKMKSLWPLWPLDSVDWESIWISCWFWFCQGSAFSNRDAWKVRILAIAPLGVLFYVAQPCLCILGTWHWSNQQDRVHPSHRSRSIDRSDIWRLRTFQLAFISIRIMWRPPSTSKYTDSALCQDFCWLLFALINLVPLICAYRAVCCLLLPDPFALSFQNVCR